MKYFSPDSSGKEAISNVKVVFFKEGQTSR